MEKFIKQSEFKFELREMIESEKKRKIKVDKNSVCEWNEDKQEGYIAALRMVDRELL